MAQRMVRVRNVTRGTVVADRVRVARSMIDRNVGLLGRPDLAVREGLWIERSPSIHMFLMRFAIDAVFIAADGRVTKIVEGLRPWRAVLWARGSRDCLELRAGSAADSGTAVGDLLAVEELAAGEVSPRDPTAPETRL